MDEEVVVEEVVVVDEEVVVVDFDAAGDGFEPHAASTTASTGTAKTFNLTRTMLAAPTAGMWWQGPVAEPFGSATGPKLTRRQPPAR